MNRIQKRTAQTINKTTDPIVQRGLRKDAPVPVPLDFLQNLASVAQGNIERRPPKLKLKNRKRRSGLEEIEAAASLGAINPLVSKETAEITLEMAELIIRRQAEINATGSDGAKAGLANLERMLRMFEHIYALSSGSQFARTKS